MSATLQSASEWMDALRDNRVSALTLRTRLELLASVAKLIGDVEHK